MTDYFLVHLARCHFPGPQWFERGNDPELRVAPMTYGICRGEIRSDAKVGDRFFFFAHDQDKLHDGAYYLTALFIVGEKITQEEAALRFPGRPNVLLEASTKSAWSPHSVADYIEKHSGKLRWPGKTLYLQHGAHLPRHLFDEQVTDDRRFVHAFWDDHEDWKTTRLKSPYLVAASSSKVLSTPISYRTLRRDCTGLPPTLRLAPKSRFPHPPLSTEYPNRRLAPDAVEHVADYVRRAPARSLPYVPVPAEVAVAGYYVRCERRGRDARSRYRPYGSNVAATSDD